ncbi:MAG: DNA cytosine methyltransferase [Rhizobiaceae bacterium]|nr:DNA cytosine methyltransferase [Rhizobiaceae bacterium]MCC0000940.1 DNA cytosine methyltransferase [Methylobacteriaceae bacterium]
MRALDLFCGAGGASKGLMDAGFDVIGVDLAPQKHYPGAFIQVDVLKLPVMFLQMFDLVWASPPCQAHTQLKSLPGAKKHLDLIPQTRALLQKAGVPYIIENVEGAPLIDPVTLCGTMFGLGIPEAELHRHRIFETSFPVLTPECDHGLKPSVIGIYGGHVRNRQRREGSSNRGVADFTPDQGRQAMGTPWMNLKEMSQAIPPAYSQFLARQWLGQQPHQEAYA